MRTVYPKFASRVFTRDVPQIPVISSGESDSEDTEIDYHLESDTEVDIEVDDEDDDFGVLPN